jgi:hypothetical protein
MFVVERLLAKTTTHYEYLPSLDGFTVATGNLIALFGRELPCHLLALNQATTPNFKDSSGSC